MDRWQEQFAQQMGTLCSQSSSCFSRFVEEMLEPAVELMTGFLDRWHYQVTTPACDKGRQAYRFALTEDGYLLVWFRLEGLDTLECEYEYSLPGVGRTQGVRTTGSLRAADAEWVESCFQSALSDFVTKFLELGTRSRTPELVTA